MKLLILFLTIPTLARAQLIPYDKQLHVGVGIVVGGAVTAVSKNPKRAFYYGVVSGLALGLAKEAYDSKYRGNVESMDVVTTVAGSLIGAFVAKKIKLKRKKKSHENITHI
jgi:uncharacterized protein YfiM (DUF2279 family)